jgi:type I restriction enzyme S subunit
MEVMLDHKQAESGVTPVDWIRRPLRTIGRWFSGSTPSLANTKYWSGDIPWVSPKDMKVRRISDSQDHISSLAVADGTRILPPGAILIVIRGMILAHSLPAARTEKPLSFNQDIKAVVTSGNIDSQFLLYWLIANEHSLRSLTTESTHGTKRLPTEMLFRVLVPCPPLSEQEAIAGALNDADILIESLEQLLAKKRQIKRGAMQGLLTGKRRLPGSSKEWDLKTLGELFDFSGGFTASRAQLSSEGYCYLHYGDIHTSKKPFVDVCSEYQDLPKLDISLKRISSTSLLADGDVVFVDASEDEEGTSKHVVITNTDGVPFISGLHTIVAKSKTEELNHQYRRYCFQTSAVKTQFRFFAVGTKVAGISKSNIAKITLPIPSVPEQSAIAAILSDMDAEIEDLEAKLAKARQIKQGIMRELLTGRIRLV